MKTLTHRHLRFTPADTTADLEGDYGRVIENGKWSSYVRTMLSKNGFDLSRRIYKSRGVPGFDCILTQDI